MTSYQWIGPSAGSWRTPANWDDLTDNLDPSATAPGSLDTVSIVGPTTTYLFIDGAGAAESLTLTGDTALDGTIDAAFAALPSGTLSIEGGATLDASSVATSGTVFVTGAGARLAAGNALSMAGGALTMTGGLLQAQSVTLDGVGAILSVGAAATAEIGLVTSPNATVPAGALSVDAGYTIGVNNIGSLFPSAILGVVIDNGMIAANDLDFGNLYFLSGVGGGAPASSLSGAGTVEATAGGTVELGGAVTGGALTFLAQTGATLGFDAAVAAGANVALSGGDVVRIGATGADAPSAFAATIGGFDATDVLLVEGASVTSLAYQSGTLSLIDGTRTVDTLPVAGNFTTQSFASYAVGASVAEIVLAPGAAGAPGPGTGGADSYVWTGPLAGDWNTDANWHDVTASQTPAAVAPGSLDLVTFDSPANVFQVIGGAGTAAGIDFNGENLIGGAIAAGTITSGGSLEVLPAGTLTVARGTLAADLSVLGSGASLVATGALTFNAGTLWATGGGSAQIAAATLGGIAVSTGIVVDAQSSVEIGTAGGAAPGALSIDAGATLDVANSSSVSPAVILGAVAVDGALLADDLDLGNTYYQAGLAPGGPASSLAGSGTLEAATGGTVEIGGAVLAGGLTLQADPGATLRLDGPVAAGDTVALGGGDVAQIGSSDATAPPGFAGAISGFGASDVLLLEGDAFTGAAYAAGTLSVASGGTVAEAIAVPGFADGQAFDVVPTGADAAEVVLAPTPQGGGASGGTAGADNYAWIGPMAGDWGAAANWSDTTAGLAPAAVAPGSLDLVTIDNSSGAFGVITGTGDAASLAFGGDNIVLGDIFGGAATNAGSLVVGAGGTFTAATLATVSASVTGPGATLAMSGAITLSIGSLSAASGGLARAGSLTLAGLNTGIVVDATSILEVGTADTGAAGALTVDARATLAVSNTGTVSPSYLLGNIVVNGLLAAAELDIGNQYFYPGAADFGPVTSLLGGGTVEAMAGGAVEFGVPLAPSSLAVQIDQGATARFDGNVGAGIAVTMTGSGDVLQIGSAGASTDIAFDATVSGFGLSDTMLVTGAPITGTSFAASANGGTLEVYDTAGAAQSVVLLGDFADEDFVISASAANRTQISLVTACFAEGTRIATPDGGVEVERLRVGDHVLTSAGYARAAVWIGHRALHCARHSRPHDVWPVRVRKNAFGAGRPARDLLLSPDHGVFVDGRLIPIRHLLNGASVVQEMAETITYFHVELATHDVILAEGLAVESYLDTGNRAAFANGGAVVMAQPDFALSVWASDACAALATEGPAVAAARALLLRRLPLLGFQVADDPALEISIDGAAAEARMSGIWIGVRVPSGARALALRSRVAAPAECDPASDDWRRLGVPVAAVRIDDEALALDDPRFGAGWRDPEPELRWTDGFGTLNVEGAAWVEIAAPRGLLGYPVATENGGGAGGGERSDGVVRRRRPVAGEAAKAAAGRDAARSAEIVPMRRRGARPKCAEDAMPAW